MIGLSATGATTSSLPRMRSLNFFTLRSFPYSFRLSELLQSFLDGAADENLYHFSLIFGRAAVVVRGITFCRGDFAHFLESGIGNRFSTQNFFGFSGAHDGRSDGIETDAHILASAVAGFQGNGDADRGEMFNATRREFHV